MGATCAKDPEPRVVARGSAYRVGHTALEHPKYSSADTEPRAATITSAGVSASGAPCSGLHAVDGNALYVRDFDGEAMEAGGRCSDDDNDDTASAGMLTRQPTNLLTTGGTAADVSMCFAAIDESKTIDRDDQGLGQQTLLHIWLDDQVNVRLKKSVMTPEECAEARNALRRKLRITACSERAALSVGPTDRHHHVSAATIFTNTALSPSTASQLEKRRPDISAADSPVAEPQSPSVLTMMKRAVSRRPM